MTPWLFTEEVWFNMHRLQAIRLAEIDIELNALYQSKMLDNPMKVLDYKVESLLNKVKPNSALD